jgi:hypothetical protein
MSRAPLGPRRRHLALSILLAMAVEPNEAAHLALVDQAARDVEHPLEPAPSV